jgi:leucyl/phenylalanyl-tRNA--protein transferase
VPVEPVEPVEPPRSRWTFDDPRDCDPDEDVVGIGGDLEPGTLLAAYRLGIFPMPHEGRRPPMVWFSPVRRGILPLDGMRVSRSLRRATRNFEIRIDTAFADVVAACADPRRPQGWITEEVAAAYTELHRLGWAHSVECWQQDRLVGGLYGVAIGGLFAGESMFSGVRDASKVALVALVERMHDEHAADRLLDVQWRTPHLASLGVVEVSRDDYCGRLARALRVPGLAWEPGPSPTTTRP